MLMKPARSMWYPWKTWVEPRSTPVAKKATRLDPRADKCRSATGRSPVWLDRRTLLVAILHAETMKDLSCICGLGKVDWAGRVRMVYVKSKETLDGAKILDCVGFGKLRLKVINALNSVRKNKKIIYINSYNSCIFAILLDKNGFVCIRLFVSMGGQFGFDVSGPEISGLFEAIKSFVNY